MLIFTFIVYRFLVFTADLTFQINLETNNKKCENQNLLKIEIQIFVMSFEDNTPSREILIVCNQLLANYDFKKTLWKMEELYKKIFDDPKVNQNRLSFERFVDDMNWIISHGLISFHDDKLNLDEFTKNLLVHYFHEHREIMED